MAATATARKQAAAPVLELTAERDVLESALRRLADIAKGVPSLPVTTHVRIRCDGITAAVRACNLDQDIEITLPADIGGEGDLCLPAKPLRDIVAGFRSGASVTLRATDGRCAVASGRSRYSLNALPGSDFPYLDAADGVRFTLPGPAIADAIDRLSFAIGQEESRWFLCGIFWTVVPLDGADKLVLVSGNGQALAIRALPAPPDLTTLGMPPKGGIIVPATALPALQRMAEENEIIALTASDSKLAAEAGDTRFLTKLLDSNYPDFRRFMPAPSGREARVDRAETVAALERLGAVEGQGHRGAKIEASADSFVLSNTNPDIGDAAEEIAAEISQGCGFGVLRPNLLAALAAFQSETVTFDQAEIGKPILVRGAGEADAGFDAVLMPFRV